MVSCNLPSIAFLLNFERSKNDFQPPSKTIRLSSGPLVLTCNNDALGNIRLLSRSHSRLEAGYVS